MEASYWGCEPATGGSGVREKPRRSGEGGCDDEVDADDRRVGGGSGPCCGARGRRLRRQRRRDQWRHRLELRRAGRDHLLARPDAGRRGAAPADDRRFQQDPFRHRRLQGLRRRQLGPDAAEGHRRTAGRQLSRHRLHLRLRPRQPRRRRPARQSDRRDRFRRDRLGPLRGRRRAGGDRRRSTPGGAGVHRQPRGRLQQGHLRRGRDGLPDRRLVVGRLHVRGGGAQRPGRRDRRLRLARNRRRGHDLADLADGLAGRRRHRQRGRRERRLRRALRRAGARRDRRRRPTTAPSTSTAPPAPSACSSSSRAARWR